MNKVKCEKGKVGGRERREIGKPYFPTAISGKPSVIRHAPQPRRNPPASLTLANPPDAFPRHSRAKVSTIH